MRGVAQGHNAGPGMQTVRPEMRRFLWAYPNFGPGADLNSSHSGAGTLDDCASWRGARDSPQNSLVPSISQAYPPPSQFFSPGTLSSSQVFQRQQQEERLQDRELEQKTRQLSQHQHWLLSSTTGEPGPGTCPSSSPVSASVVDPTGTTSGCGDSGPRRWKRICRGEGSDATGNDEANAGEEAWDREEETQWRRARRSGNGQKVVETGYPFPVASADTKLETDKDSFASFSQGVSSLSFASTPGGTTCFLGESSVETSKHRVLHRRRVSRLKRKEVGSLVTEDKPSDSPSVKRRVQWRRNGDDVSTLEKGTVNAEQGSVGTRQDEVDSSAPSKRSRASDLLEETCGTGVLGISHNPDCISDAPSAPGGIPGEPRTTSTASSKVHTAHPAVKASHQLSPLAEVPRSVEVKQIFPRFELSGPSTLTNKSQSNQSSVESAARVKVTKKGSFVNLSSVPFASIPEVPARGRNVASIKGSSSLPQLTQSVASASQHSISVFESMGEESVSAVFSSGGNSQGCGTSGRDGQGGAAGSFAAMYSSRARVPQHEESLYALPRFEKEKVKKKASKGVERPYDDVMECGQGSSSDDEASAKFVLSSGRVTVAAKPKKHVTIDDEFESFFAKLLL